ncbi:MAG: DmsE family decaheme c-type cytochrome, partial [Terriglobia bacterium]
GVGGTGVVTVSALLGTAGPDDKVSPGAAPATKSVDNMSPPPAAAAQGAYVGGDTCLGCHDIEAAFKKNPHYKTWEDEALPWSERGCETCHGPGQEHMDAGGDPDLLFNFKKKSAAQISDKCLDCHLQQTESTANFLRNEHGLNSVACTECHSVHTSYTETKLLKARTPALCYDCHGEVRVQFNKPFRHRIHEGFMNCADCHNQHGGFNLRQFGAAAGNDFVCYECHADKQGPFVFEHPPMRVEGCAICHEAHGSVNPRMLKRSEVRFLCIECHSGTLGVPGRSTPPTPFFHNITIPEWQNCTSCHSQIHGSNISPVFFE